MGESDDALGGRRFLVTGGLGLLGSAVVSLALDRGAEVAVLSRESHPNSALSTSGLDSRCDIQFADVCDEAAIGKVIRATAPDVVVHLAGVAVVGHASVQPREAVRSSVVGTVNVLEESRAVGAEAVVVASSDKAYGASDRLPYTEEMPLQPKYPYEAAKAAADVIARSYWFSFGLPVGVVRSVNLYGPGDTNRTRLVPQTIEAILRGNAPVVRSDGTPERDYLFVADAAAAYLHVVDLLLGGKGGGEAFNVGSGVPRRAIDVVTEILRVAGSDLEPEVRGTGVPEGEIERQVIDSARLEAATGWKAATSLEDGLARTLDWYREHPEALAA